MEILLRTLEILALIVGTVLWVNFGCWALIKVIKPESYYPWNWRILFGPWPYFHWLRND